MKTEVKEKIVACLSDEKSTVIISVLNGNRVVFRSSASAPEKIAEVTIEEAMSVITEYLSAKHTEGGLGDPKRTVVTIAARDIRQ